VTAGSPAARRAASCGEDCFLVKVHVARIQDLEEVLDRFLLCGQTVSSVVASTPVPPRPLPLPGQAG
jgi:Lrp/AsnC family transcriptional regulator, leucine-responsive regulatory protein